MPRQNNMFILCALCQITPQLFQFRNKLLNIRMAAATVTGLAHIDFDKFKGPMVLFKEWLDEAKSILKINTVLMNLATASSDGIVSNRIVVLRDFTNYGFVFVTNGNSKKIKQIIENPKVALCFHFNYVKGDQSISRQVRIEGVAEKLSQEKCRKYYNGEPLYCKIRSHICQQGEKVDWDDLKNKHDVLFQEVLNNNKSLEMPEYEVAYEVQPNTMEFYYAWNNYIADRILFEKKNENIWTSDRIAA